MKRIRYIACIICPIITVLFSIMIGFVTMYIKNTIPPLFVFLSTEFYLNWYLVCNINRHVVIPFTVASYCGLQQGSEIESRFYWYCDKCKQYTRRLAQHCLFCKKCYYYRDHHCFFFGSCILRQNMGNFILACLYASLACTYSVFTLGPYLYEYFMNTDGTKFHIYYFAFPITMIKLFLNETNQSINIFLITLFNLSISIGCFTLVYGIWKLYACLSGKQKYHLYDVKQQNIYEIFGSYGFINFIFPFNGFLHSRSLDEKYELKSV